jgi:hypothetical protein
MRSPKTLALVRALALNVASLLALVAHLLATGRLLGAVTGEVTSLAAVVALGALDTVAWDVKSVKEIIA